MVERWPHTIDIVWPGTTYQDEGGNVSFGTSADDETLSCRVKSASANSFISGLNGDYLRYSFTASIPYNAIDYSTARVRWNGKLYKIIQYQTYQARSKIWF
jgi:hypothetical protein